MIGQHDAAGADADGRGAAGDMADDDRRGGAGDAAHVVMLGQPVAAKTQPFRVAGEVERVAEGERGIAARDDRGQVENGEGDHGSAAHSCLPFVTGYRRLCKPPPGSR
jgi:hypothetical protein